MIVKNCLTSLLLLGVAACSFSPPKDGAPDIIVAPPPGDPVPRAEPRSRYGNPDSYEQFGRRYHILDTTDGYVERGIASWYGTKFHGRRTSSGEPYDMHALTAAHKTLPIPCWVEVHNLKNNKKLVLRVNDRGPFVENRIIDLSFAAATRLGIVRDGTGLVEVRAISFDQQGNAIMQAPEAAPTKVAVIEQPISRPADTIAAQQLPTSAPVDAAAAAASAELPTMANTNGSVKPVTPANEAPPIGAQINNLDNTTRLFAQLGAFSSIDNAERLFIKLRDLGFENARILENLDLDPRLFRIQVGPVANQEEYDHLLERLAINGIENATRVIH